MTGQALPSLSPPPPARLTTESMFSGTICLICFLFLLAQVQVTGNNFLHNRRNLPCVRCLPLGTTSGLGAAACHPKIIK